MEEQRKRAYRRLRLAASDSTESGMFTQNQLTDVVFHLHANDVLTNRTRERIASLVVSSDILELLCDELLAANSTDVDKKFEDALQNAKLTRAASLFRKALDETVQPLSEEDLIESRRRELAKEYESFATINLFTYEDNPMPIEKLFVQIELKTDSDDMTVNSYQRAFERFLNINTLKKLLIIWGQPGQGKTVLIKKICYDWAQTVKGNITKENRYIADVRLLYAYTLRNLDEKVKKIIKLFANNSALISHINNPKQILVLLDGFDECQTPTLCVELHSILFNKATPPPFPLIVTTRPFAIQNMARHMFTAEVCGIVETKVPEFVRRYTTCVENAARVTMYIEENLLLDERIFRSPLLLALLCKLLESNAYLQDDKKALPQTQTALYIEFCDLLCNEERHKYSQADEGGNLFEHEIVIQLSRFAFEKTICDDSRLVFDEAELKTSIEFKVDVERALRIGFLTTDDAPQYRQKSTPRRLSFLHRTFQEFFAAVYASENPELFGKRFSDMKFQALLSNQVLIFLAGLIDDTKDISDVLTKCLHAKLSNASQLTPAQRTTQLQEWQQSFPMAAVGVDDPEQSFFDYFNDALFSLLADLQCEAKSERIARILFEPLLSALYKNGEWGTAPLVNAMLQRSIRIKVDIKRFLPPGYDLLSVFSVLAATQQKLHVRLLLGPLSASATFMHQARGKDEHRLKQNAPSSRLLEATTKLFFTGNVSSFIALFGSGLRLRVYSHGMLTFRAKIRDVDINVDTKADTKDGIIVQSTSDSLSTSRGLLEITQDGQLDIFYEESIGSLQWAQIRDAIAAINQLDWLTFVFRLSPSARSTVKANGSDRHRQASNAVWASANNLHIASLDFSRLLHQSDAVVGLRDTFQSVKASKILLTACKLSSEDFCAVFSPASCCDWKALFFINCISSSLSGATIFEEATKIFEKFSSIRRIKFKGCHFPLVEAETDFIIGSFCDLRESRHWLNLSFVYCCNLNAMQRSRLKELGAYVVP